VDLIGLRLGGRDIVTQFISLDRNGRLVVKKGYRWDGPSGPTIDSDSFMRGALVHDALYQLLRGGHFGAPESKGWVRARKAADGEMRRICREDGMIIFRRLYTHWAVRKFAAYAAKPQTPVTGNQVAPDPPRTKNVKLKVVSI